MLLPTFVSFCLLMSHIMQFFSKLTTTCDISLEKVAQVIRKGQGMSGKVIKRCHLLLGKAKVFLREKIMPIL